MNARPAPNPLVVPAAGRPLMDKEPKTAVITGASRGIGRAFAYRLASEGMNLVVLARSAPELESMAKDLKDRYSVEVTARVADLSDDRDVAGIEDFLRVLRVDLMINNAGFGTVGHFADIAVDSHLQMVNLHVRSPLRLTHAVLPGMIRRKEGVVINVCSVNAFLPGHVTYSATKSFLLMFSQALAGELKGTGVRVQALCPGFTRTAFHDAPDLQKIRARVPSLLWTSPEVVVDSSLAALAKGKVICIPRLTYRLIVAAYRNPVTRLLMQFGNRFGPGG